MSVSSDACVAKGAGLEGPVPDHGPSVGVLQLQMPGNGRGGAVITPRTSAKPDLKIVEAAYSLAATRCASFMRPPTSGEVAAALAEAGFRLGSTPTRELVNTLNAARQAAGEAVLPVCVNSHFLSPALAAHTHGLLVAKLKRDPSVEEHAKLLGDTLGKRVPVQRVAEKIAEWNRVHPSERLEHAPVGYRCGFFPADVWRAYLKYRRRHAKEAPLPTEYPRYEDLVKEIKTLLPESRPTKENLVSAVAHLRKQGHELIVRGTRPRALTPKMLSCALEHAAAAKTDGEPLKTGEILKALRELYPNARVSRDTLSKHLSERSERPASRPVPAAAWQRRQLRLEPEVAVGAYIAAAARLDDIVPFPSLEALAERLNYGQAAVSSALHCYSRDNRGRAGTDVMPPLLPAGHTIARDIRTLLCCALGARAAEAQGSRTPFDLPLVAYLDGHKPHYYTARNIQRLMSRLAREGLEYPKGRDRHCDRLEFYEAALLWCVAKAVAAPEEITRAAARSMHDLEAVSVSGRRERSKALPAALHALNLFEEVAGTADLDFADGQMQDLHRRVRRALESYGLSLPMSIKPPMPGNAREAVHSELPPHVIHHGRLKEIYAACANRRESALRTWLVPIGERTGLIAMLEKECAERGETLDQAAARHGLDPRQVAEWRRTTEVREAHVRALTAHKELDRVRDYVKALDASGRAEVLGKVRAALQSGLSLADALERTGCPPAAYRYLLHRRCLTVPLLFRFCEVDAVEQGAKGDLAARTQLLERCQVSERHFEQWVRKRDAFRERMSRSPERVQVATIKKISGPEEREELLQHIGRMLSKGRPLGKILRATAIPAAAYDSLVSERARNLRFKELQNNPARLVQAMERFSLIAVYGDEYGAAVREAAGTAFPGIRGRRLASIVESGLKALFSPLLTAEEYRFLDPVAEIAPKLLYRSGDHLLVRAVLGDRFGFPGEERIRLFEYRHELGLPVCHPWDAKTAADVDTALERVRKLSSKDTAQRPESRNSHSYTQ